MTQEDKQLLWVDLCARLPYNVIGATVHGKHKATCIDMQEGTIYISCDEWVCYFKPYLRSMSNMTEEEYKSVSWEGCSHTYNYSSKSGFRFIEIKTFTLNILNWLNAHHFDYRGLIEKDLALEAPNDMYKYD